MIPKPDEPNSELIEQAAAWMLALDARGQNAATRRAFAQWLKASPQNVDEFLRVSALRRDLANLPEAEDISSLVAAARPHAVPLPVASRAPASSPPSQSRGVTAWRRFAGRRPSWAWAAAGSVVVFALTLWVWHYGSGGAMHQTARGEMRSIMLADGSQIDLNATSAVRVEVTPRRRHVDVVAGEALLTVAKDRKRPFTVAAGMMSVEVVGTRFNVRRDSFGDTDRTALTVLEGHVRLAVLKDASSRGDGRFPDAKESGAVPMETVPATPPPADIQPQLLELSTGDQVVVEDGVVGVRAPANLDNVTAWLDRRLVFEAAPLPEVLMEFNRHTTREQLELAAPALASRKITGVFDARRSSALLAFLEQQQGVRLERRGNVIRVVQDQVADRRGET